MNRDFILEKLIPLLEASRKEADNRTPHYDQGDFCRIKDRIASEHPCVTSACLAGFTHFATMGEKHWLHFAGNFSDLDVADREAWIDEQGARLGLAIEQSTALFEYHDVGVTGAVVMLRWLVEQPDDVTPHEIRKRWVEVASEYPRRVYS